MRGRRKGWHWGRFSIGFPGRSVQKPPRVSTPRGVPFRPPQASRQGWPHRRSLQAAAGHPPGVALLYTPIPLRCWRTGAPYIVGPPLAAGQPDAASVACVGLARHRWPASCWHGIGGLRRAGTGFRYRFWGWPFSTRYGRAAGGGVVYSRATPCGWPASRSHRLPVTLLGVACLALARASVTASEGHPWRVACSLFTTTLFFSAS